MRDQRHCTCKLALPWSGATLVKDQHHQLIGPALAVISEECDGALAL